MNSSFERSKRWQVKSQPPVINLLQDSHDTLAVMLEAVRDYKDVPDGQALIAELRVCVVIPSAVGYSKRRLQLQQAQAHVFR